MATSRTEDALAEIITEFQTISTANGFRTDPNQVINAIRPLSRISQYPEIGIELGPEQMIPLDDNWTVFDTVVAVYVVGAQNANTSVDDDSSELATATEALRHDIKRIIYKIMKKYMNAALSKWNITPKQNITVYPVMMLGEKRNRAQVVAQFSIRIRTQGATFIDDADAQDFGATGGGAIDGGSF